MPSEAPFISRALKLVSLAIIVATVAIAATAAYSGYLEYGALTSSVDGAKGNNITASLNGSTISIAGLIVPNKMTFPITLELQGFVSLNNISVGNFDSGTYVIQPNQSTTVNVSVPLGFENLLANSTVLEAVAFNSSLLSISTTISAHMVPLLGINMTRVANATVGPVFGDFSANLNLSGIQLSSDGKEITVPIIVAFENSSPLSQGTFWARVNLTQIPGKSYGNYGSGSGPLSFVQGQNSESINLALPLSDFSEKNLPTGAYTFEIQLSQTNSSQPFAQITKAVSV